jgi:hypothetical protein
LFGGLFLIVVALAVLVQTALLLMSPVTLTFGFLFGTVISVLSAIIIAQALKIITNGKLDMLAPLAMTFSAVSNWILQIGADAGWNPSKDQVAWSAFGGCMSIVSTFYSLADLLKGSFLASFCFGMSIVSLVLGWYATASNSVSLGLISLALGAVPFFYGLLGCFRGDERLLASVTTVFAGIGLMCGSKSL